MAENYAVPKVRESWGLQDETVEEFTSSVSGVNSDFANGGPRYVGDLYIPQGDMLTGVAPFMLERETGSYSSYKVFHSPEIFVYVD